MNKLEEFYAEVSSLLLNLAISNNNNDIIPAIIEAININKNLVSQPFLSNDIDIESTFNVIEFWQSTCEGIPVRLKKGNYNFKILRSSRYYSDFDLWCKEVVWWGNKKGAYLYPSITNNNIKSNILPLNKELDGHF